MEIFRMLKKKSASLSAPYSLNFHIFLEKKQLFHYTLILDRLWGHHIRSAEDVSYSFFSVYYGHLWLPLPQPTGQWFTVHCVTIHKYLVLLPRGGLYFGPWSTAMWPCDSLWPVRYKQKYNVLFPWGSFKSQCILCPALFFLCHDEWQCSRYKQLCQPGLYRVLEGRKC